MGTFLDQTVVLLKDREKPVFDAPDFRYDLSEAGELDSEGYFYERGELGTFAERLKKQAEMRNSPGFKVAQAIGQGLKQNSVGLSYYVAKGEAPPEQDLNTWQQILAGITSIVSDPVTYLSFGLGGFVGRQAVKQVSKEGVKRLAARSISTGIGLGGLEAVHDPLRQQIETGDYDPLRHLINTWKQMLLGGVAGAAGTIPKVGLPAEISAFAVGGAALEKRVPTLDDFVHATGTILGIKAANAVGKALWNVARGERPTRDDAVAVAETFPDDRARVVAVTDGLRQGVMRISPETKRLEEVVKSNEPERISAMPFGEVEKGQLLTPEGAVAFMRAHPELAAEVAADPAPSRKSFMKVRTAAPKAHVERWSAEERRALVKLIQAQEREPLKAEEPEPTPEPVFISEAMGAGKGMAQEARDELFRLRLEGEARGAKVKAPTRQPDNRRIHLALERSFKTKEGKRRDIVERDGWLYFMDKDEPVRPRSLRRVEERLGLRYDFGALEPLSVEPTGETPPARPPSSLTEFAKNEGYETLPKKGTKSRAVLKKAYEEQKRESREETPEAEAGEAPLTIEKFAALEGLESLPKKGTKRRTELDKQHTLEVGVPLSPLEAAGFAVSLDAVAKLAQRGLKAGDVFRRRFFRSRGLLPQTAFDAKRTRDGYLLSQMQQTSFSLYDMGRGAKVAYGGMEKMTESDLLKIDAVLKGELGIENLPEPMRQSVADFRSHIDSLSEYAVDIGAIEGPLAGFVLAGTKEARTSPRIQEKIRNIIRLQHPKMSKEEIEGLLYEVLKSRDTTYVHRSYRAHDVDIKYEDLDVGVRNKSAALLRGEFPNETDAQIQHRIERMLYEAYEAGSPLAYLQKAGLGGKDLSILKRRTLDEMPEIRALLGEYKDPRIGYPRSVAKLADLIANHKFLTEVRADGLGKWLFEPGDPNIDPKAHAQIAADTSKAMYPLNGLYASRELVGAFQRATEPLPIGPILRYYMKANALTKIAVTVANPQTHVRNFTGNSMFAIAAGHWRAWKAMTATKGALASLNAMTAPEWRAYVRKLQELRVIGDSARPEELKAMTADALKRAGNAEEFFEKYLPKPIVKAGKAHFTAYRIEDDWGKMSGFENDMARYGKRLPELPRADLEKRAARMVRNEYPTWSMVPEFFRLLRRAPMGPFVSFPAEVYRIGYNALKLIEADWADPRTRPIAAERVVGLLTAATITGGVATAFNYIAGTTAQKLKDLRHFLAPWSKNSTLIAWDIARAKYRTIDLSYTDPWEYLKKPVMAFLRGEDWEEKLKGAMWEAAEPFVAEEMFAERVLNIARNKKKSGGPVHMEGDSDPVKVVKDLTHFFEVFEPGYTRALRRIAKGFKGTVEPYGKTYDPRFESLAVYSGLRVNEVDIPQALSWKARDFKKGVSDATRILSTVVSRRGVVTDDEIRQAYKSADRARRKAFEEFQEQVSAAQRLGVTREEIKRTLRAAGVSKQKIALVLTGEYRPYLPTNAFLDSVIKRVKTQPVEGGATIGDYRRRRDLVRQLAREQL